MQNPESQDLRGIPGSNRNPEAHNTSNKVEPTDTARLYQEHLILSRNFIRLQDEVERLRRERNEVESSAEHEQRAEEASSVPSWIRRNRFAVAIIVILGTLSVPIGARAIAYLGSYERTDDAQVDAHIDPISPRLNGTILHVYVDDNEHVKAGELLADVDPRDYEVAIKEAQANYEQARAQVEIARKEYEMASARLVAARANDAKARRDIARYRILSQTGVASADEYERASATSKVTAATVAAEAAATEAASKTCAARQASVTAAKAALERSVLNLSYTKIAAPVDGIVGKRSVEVGQRVDPGEELLAIVRDDALWITANFKETQLAHMYRGQRATIHVDSYDADLDGYVESLSGASGQKYSLLPPENATGNYVKIVQRIPVRIKLANQQQTARLRPGMSVEATVWLK